MCRNLAPTNIMKIIELPTIARNSPVFECENCGRQSLICQLHRRANSRRLSCHCGKDSINLPQNASDWKVTRNIEHESTCDPVGRDGLGDFSLPTTSSGTPTTQHPKTMPTINHPSKPSTAPTRKLVGVAQERLVVPLSCPHCGHRITHGLNGYCSFVCAVESQTKKHIRP